MEAWSTSPREIKNSKSVVDQSNVKEVVKAAVIRNNNDRKAKSDIFHTLAPIYHLSKICGLLPVKFTEDMYGKFRGQLNVPEVVYGVSIVVGCVVGQCYGLYRDLRNGWQNSTRLSSETAITVTCSDVFAVISAAFTAILGSTYRWRHLQDALNKIVDVDVKLNIPTTKSLRKKSVIAIVVFVVYVVTISTLDFISWKASSANRDNRRFGDKGPINYSLLYLMYIVITIFELQYALVMLNVGERFLKLNKRIENLLKCNATLESFRKNVMTSEIQDTNRETLAFFSSEMGHSRLRRTNKVADFAASDEEVITIDAVDELITLHGTLCDVVIHVNKAYGGALVIATISCLIHLIITPYFLYNEIFSDANSTWYVLTMQVFWTIYHVARLLLYIQPCYMVSVKVKRTGALVSEALTSGWNVMVKKQLEIFAIQLIQRPVEFSASGLFFIDRNLLTGIAGSVTTYLVILVQFQTADDTKGTKNLLQNATELLRNATMKNFTFKSS